MPRHFVARPQHQQALKQRLFCPDPDIPGMLVVTALYGPAGIGKSVLAASLGHDPTLQARFSEGVLWVTLGPTPDILSALIGWIRALHDTDLQPTTVEQATAHLRTLLYNKQVLLIVDDVWQPTHLEPFRVGQGRSRLLVTSRSAKIADAQRHDLDAMTPQAAQTILAKLLGEALIGYESQALAFAERVEYVPRALEQGAAQVQDGMTWEELLDYWE